MAPTSTSKRNTSNGTVSNTSSSKSKTKARKTTSSSSLSRKTTASSSSTSSSFLSSLPSRHRKRRQTSLSRFQKRLKSKTTPSNNDNSGGDSGGDGIVVVDPNDIATSILKSSTADVATKNNVSGTSGASGDSDVGDGDTCSSTIVDDTTEKSNSNENENESNGKIDAGQKGKTVETIEIIDTQEEEQRKADLERCDSGRGEGNRTENEIQVKTTGIDCDKDKSSTLMTTQQQKQQSFMLTQKTRNTSSSSENKNSNKNNEKGNEGNNDHRQIPPISFSLSSNEESQPQSLDFVKSLITSDFQNSQLSIDSAATDDNDGTATTSKVNAKQQLTTQINQLITSHLENHIQSLQDQLQQYKQKCRNLEKTQSLHAQQFQKRHDKYKSKESKYKTAIVQYQAQVNNYDNENKSLQRQVFALQNTVSERDDTIGLLNRSLDESTKGLVKYKEQVMNWLKSIGFQLGSDETDGVVFSRVVQWKVSAPPQPSLQVPRVVAVTDNVENSDNNTVNRLDAKVTQNEKSPNNTTNGISKNLDDARNIPCIGPDASSVTQPSGTSASAADAVSTISSPLPTLPMPSRVCTTSPPTNSTTKTFSITKVNHNKGAKVSLSPKRLDYENKDDKEEEQTHPQSQQFRFDSKIIGDELDCDSSTSDGGGASILEDEEKEEEKEADNKTTKRAQRDEQESDTHDLSAAGTSMDHDKNHKQVPLRSTDESRNARFVTPASLRNKNGSKNLGGENTLQRRDLKRKRDGDFKGSGSTKNSTTMSNKNVIHAAERTARTRDAPSKNIVQPCLPLGDKLDFPDEKSSLPATLIPSRRHKIDSASNQTSKKGEEKTGTHKFKYQEVVRGKKARDALRGFDCEECRKFIDAVCADNKVFNRDAMVMKCSRHRSNFSPPQTPEGFWELSFADERTGKLVAATDGESEGGSQRHISEEV